jgi:hypothetical protein
MSKMNFDEVRHEEHTAAHSRCSVHQHITKEMFKPCSHKHALPLRAAAGTTQQVAFHACSPYADAMQYAHVALWRHCRQYKLWGFIDRSYLINLAYPGEVIYSVRDKVWHLVVNMIDGLAALTLRMTPTRH